MRLLSQWLRGIAGLLFGLLGLNGASEEMANWAEWLQLLHRLMANPIIFMGAWLAGVVVMAHAWSDHLLERKLATAGGTTKREFPARFTNWDRVSDLTLRQAAWLWSELEPLSDDLSGTAAHPALRRLEVDQDKGKLPKGDASTVKIDRQKLIDYAIDRGERPKFLFPDERSLYSWFWKRSEAAPKEIQDYSMKLSDYRFHAYQTRGGANFDYREANREFLRALRDGTALGVARLKKDGLVFAYQKLPKRMWKKAEFVAYGDDVKIGQAIYTDLRLKVIGKKDAKAEASVY